MLTIYNYVLLFYTTEKRGLFMTDKNDKNVRVLVDAEFSFMLGKFELCDKITQEQAIRLIESLKKVTPHKNRCFADITAEYITGAFINTEGRKYSSDKLVLSPTLANKVRCSECSKKLTERQRTQTCVQNIRSGKCSDKLVLRTIGKVLLSDIYYRKQK